MNLSGAEWRNDTYLSQFNVSPELVFLLVPAEPCRKSERTLWPRSLLHAPSDPTRQNRFFECICAHLTFAQDMKEANSHLLNGLHLYKAFHLSAGGVVCKQEPHTVVGDLHRHSPVHCVLVSRAEHSEVVASSCSRERSGVGHDDDVWFHKLKCPTRRVYFVSVRAIHLLVCIIPSRELLLGPLVFIVATVWALISLQCSDVNFWHSSPPNTVVPSFQSTIMVNSVYRTHFKGLISTIVLIVIVSPLNIIYSCCYQLFYHWLIMN